MVSKDKAIIVPAKFTIHGHLYSKEGALLNGAKVSCIDHETLSLADGFYVLEDLPLGRYEVHVVLTGFQSATKTVSIKENKIVVLNFQLSKSLGSATISGWVYDSKTGKSIECGGTIILVQPISNRYANIDINGQYTFNNLPAGIYSLSTSIPEYDDADVLLTVLDGESAVHNFSCNPNIEVEPAWG
jgi:hypothetical protein